MIRGPRGSWLPLLFLKSHFVRDVFQENCFSIIIQGIQNFFGPGVPRISSETLDIELIQNTYQNKQDQSEMHIG